VSAILTDQTKNACLDSGQAGSLSQGTPHLGLHTALGIGGAEVAGGSPAYARKPVSFTAAAAGARDIAASVLFDVPASMTIMAVSLHDAPTGGTRRAWLPVGSSAPRACSVDSAGVTANLIFSPAHGLVADNRVCFWAGIGAGLPTGLSEDTAYWVIATGLTTDAFSVSTSQGGAAVDLTAIGDGSVCKFTPVTTAAQDTYTVSSFQISLPG
jgi:hypothetical protein